jgi:hypothetical protein
MTRTDIPRLLAIIEGLETKLTAATEALECIAHPLNEPDGYSAVHTAKTALQQLRGEK